MTVPDGFRFYTADDPLAARVRWALERIFALPRPRVDGLLCDPHRRLLMRVAEDGSLGGFVVFKDYKDVLLSPDNAFIGREDKALLGAPGLQVVSFEQVWYRDGDFDMARIIRETLPAMSQILADEVSRHAILCLLPEGPETLVMRELLEELGFHRNPNVYCDFRFVLTRVPAVDENLAAAPADIDLRSFTDPPDPDLLAATFNRVFAEKQDLLDPEAVQGMLELHSFAHELSFWVQREGRVAGFVLMYWSAPGVAKLSLVGTDPDFRGLGLVRTCTPSFMHACQRHAVRELHFTIHADNSRPARIAQALGAEAYQRRRTWLRVV